MKKEKIESYKVALILTAGGSSVRFGKNKLLEKVGGIPVILRSLLAFQQIELAETVVTVAKDFKQEFADIIPESLSNVKIVDGGKNRQESVFNGLLALSPDIDFVIIHDAARPLVKPETIKKCLKSAVDNGAAIVAVKTVDTVKIVDKNGLIINTPNRENLWNVQTPQIFGYSLILDAHKKLQGQNFSDDAGLLEYLGNKVYVVEGEYSNVKITNPSDIAIAESFLKNSR